MDFKYLKEEQGQNKPLRSIEIKSKHVTVLAMVQECRKLIRLRNYNLYFHIWIYKFVLKCYDTR